MLLRLIIITSQAQTTVLILLDKWLFRLLATTLPFIAKLYTKRFANTESLK